MVDGATSTATPVLSGVPQGSVLGPLLFLLYINHISTLQLTNGSTLTMYADDILLSKPISCPEDYGGLQSDINTIHDCISASHLTLNPSKCKYLICSKKRHPYLPSAGLQLDGIALEQVNSYRYLGVVVSSKLTWSEHIEQVCSKARKLVGMLYRQFYSWADTPILLLIYLTCIRPHLEYACQLWDPSTNKNRHLLEDVQKFACRVCLKRWDLDYDSMLQLLSIPPLTIRREYLKLTTMYNIIHGHSHFPSGLFAHSNFPYSSNRSLNFTRPFAHTNYLYHSFVPSVIGLWNNLPHSLKAMPSISTFKRSLLYHFYHVGAC